MAGGFAGGYYYVAPSLPQAEELRDIRLQRPSSIYSRDGRLLSISGDKQRTPANYEDIPEVLVQQPCLCGCNLQREGHGSLLDCFIDDHAST